MAGTETCHQGFADATGYLIGYQHTQQKPADDEHQLAEIVFAHQNVEESDVERYPHPGFGGKHGNSIEIEIVTTVEKECDGGVHYLGEELRGSESFRRFQEVRGEG